MTCINPISGDALSVVMVQFDPYPATNREGINKNIRTICNYVDRAVFSFPGVDLIVFPEYSTQGFRVDMSVRQGANCVPVDYSG